jgi:hypothetical protein
MRKANIENQQGNGDGKDAIAERFAAGASFGHCHDSEGRSDVTVALANIMQVSCKR